MRERVAKLLVTKGVRLDQLGRHAEEIAVYDEVIGRFGTAKEPALRAQVGIARHQKGLRS